MQILCRRELLRRYTRLKRGTTKKCFAAHERGTKKLRQNATEGNYFYLQKCLFFFISLGGCNDERSSTCVWLREQQASFLRTLNYTLPMHETLMCLPGTINGRREGGQDGRGGEGRGGGREEETVGPMGLWWGMSRCLNKPGWMDGRTLRM